MTMGEEPARIRFHQRGRRKITGDAGKLASLVERTRVRHIAVTTGQMSEIGARERHERADTLRPQRPGRTEHPPLAGLELRFAE